MTDRIACGGDEDPKPPEKEPEFFLKIGNKEISEKDYHLNCNLLHKLTIKLRERAIVIWVENTHLTPEQALAKAIEEFLLELK